MLWEFRVDRFVIYSNLFEIIFDTLFISDIAHICVNSINISTLLFPSQVLNISKQKTVIDHVIILLRRGRYCFVLFMIVKIASKG